MFVSYDGIVFDMLFLDGWQVESDMSNDGCDFLRWHQTIDITCVMNESATAAYKFPAVSNFATDINKKRLEEAQARLKSKQEGSAKLKSGQLPGEDKLKSALKSFGDIFGPGASSIFGNIFQLPTGSVVTPPTGTGYPSWVGQTPSLQFPKPVALQQGQTLTPPSGGQTVASGANVAPVSFVGSAVGIVRDVAKGDFKKAAKEGLESGIVGAGIGVGVPIVAGIATGTIGGIITGAATAVTEWWNETKQQLEAFGNDLGISANDIFGAGRQPLKNPTFPTPPVRRSLNPPPPEASSNASAGWTVPATFNELMQRLNKPRRPLAVWLNSGPDGSPEYLLVSPYPGLSVDALKGPVCRILHIPAIHGNVTGILKLRFETWVAPPPQFLSTSERIKTGGDLISKLKTPNQSTLRTPNFSTPSGGVITPPNTIAEGLLGGAAATVVGQGGLFPPREKPFQPTSKFATNPIVLATPPLISNRWTMRQSPDPATYLNTTIIEGTAHFRMDVLQALQITPDQLRLYFMHPIPFGYVRMPPEVTVLSDGASVQYTIVDVQQMINNPGGQRWGVHSVKARQHMEYHSSIDYARAPFAAPGSILNSLETAVRGGEMISKRI